MRRVARFIGITVSSIVALTASMARAAGPTEDCLQARYYAAAKYASCDQKALGKYFFGSTVAQFQNALSKCRIKYTDTWPKLQERFAGSGTLCQYPRFLVGGNPFGAVVIDNLTSLVWETKTHDATVHGLNNFYTLSGGGFAGTAFDGTAYTSFLETLNSGSCFQGSCDWRLPTRAELQTILSEPYPCSSFPCIDPIFGPTGTTTWSSTSDPFDPQRAWDIGFADGFAGNSFNKTNSKYVRAVRGGL